MHKKYYVINHGRKIGIFTDIKYVRNQVNKFQNADYRVFKNKHKAIKFYFSSENNLDDFFLSPDKNLDIYFDLIAYTDGSYNKQKNTFTFGTVILHKKTKIEFYAKFNNRKWLKLQNTSGEIMGVIKAIQFCLENNLKSILIYCDYKNLHFWMHNKKYIKNTEIKLFKEYINNLKTKDIIIVFKWVKSHSDNKYNDLADFLAKKAYNLNYFSEVYLKLLKK